MLECMPVDILVRVGRRIRYLRTSRGFSQESLSAQAAISRVNLSRIENGKTDAGLHTLHGIARALGVKIVDIVNVE